MERNRRKPIPWSKILLITAGSLVLLAAVCFGVWQWLAHLLPTQKEAERWQSDGDLAFSQVTCFLPADEQIGLKEIWTFRNAAATKMKEASLDTAGDQQFMLDAWSTRTKVYTDGHHGRGEASAIAVGGDFFEFHPLRLLSGDYIRQSDLMKDRIVLSEEVAWMLFGGTDLAGMTMKLNGIPFIVAGVVEQEKDFASRKANSDSLDLYMSYDGLLQLDENARINCYEVVLANPVKNFAVNAVRDKFPIGKGEILCNTERYSYGNLMSFVLHFGTRSTQTSGAVLPYWENAARLTEDWASLCCFLGTLLLIFPLVIFVIYAVKTGQKWKVRMEDDILPNMKDKTEEAIRVQQRKRWERKHKTE